MIQQPEQRQQELIQEHEQRQQQLIQLGQVIIQQREQSEWGQQQVIKLREQEMMQQREQREQHQQQLIKQREQEMMQQREQRNQERRQQHHQQQPMQQIKPLMNSGLVPLKDISMKDLAVVLDNLSFSSLVDPFLKNGVTGKAIYRVRSYQDIMDIDREKISKVVAQTFYEDHVVGWVATGLVPTELLQPRSSSPANLKVCYSNILEFCFVHI